ncbi:MAG: HDOD domain-containing protein [Nitrospirae bacterium]|nr:HDOD domain-containing protein [Nitrospirota bacterium]
MKRDEIIEKLMTLPPISNGPIKIMELLEDGKTELPDLIKIIRLSPGLTTSVLKIANKESYKHQGEIASIMDAVKIMGEAQMYKIITSAAFCSLLNKPLRGFDLISDDLLTHSIAVAIIAEVICNALKIENIEEIFTASLLHDVGKLILVEFVEDDFTEIMKHSKANRESFEIAERKILGIEHGELGAMLLEIWELPQSLIIPVRYHHDPEGKTGQYQLITDIVHIADNISRSSGIGVGDEGLQYHLSKDALKRLKLKTKMIENIMSQSLNQFNQTLKLFNN